MSEKSCFIKPESESDNKTDPFIPACTEVQNVRKSCSYDVQTQNQRADETIVEVQEEKNLKKIKVQKTITNHHEFILGTSRAER